MRILIANWHRAIIGGAEAYLQTLIPELLAHGHEVAVLHGYVTTGSRPTIDAAVGRVPCWSCEEIGVTSLLQRVSGWHPDVVYTHGLESIQIEAALVDRYPSVFFAHAYYGTCTTGRKSHAFPVRTPCSRRFGPMCLALHYPKRCGGLNPLTAVRDYRLQAQRNALLKRFHAVLVASHHMYEELRNNGVESSRLILAPLPPGNVTAQPDPPSRRFPKGRILLMSRLTDLKGGDYLIQALPAAAKALDRQLHLVIAGTGGEEAKLKALAARLGVPVEFTGWLADDRRREVICNCDLLAFPSWWPEPYGLAGIESACFGIPAAGYAVGGIPDWLIAGYSGELAPGNPPTVTGLSEAIVRALGDANNYHRLCVGAWTVARQLTMRRHLEQLEGVFHTVMQRPVLVQD